MKILLLVIGMVFILEGIPYVAFPESMQEWLQKNHPGAVALVSIGCGADQNPDSGVTGDNTEAASAQGRQIADEIGPGAVAGPLDRILGMAARRHDLVEIFGDGVRFEQRDLIDDQSWGEIDLDNEETQQDLELHAVTTRHALYSSVRPGLSRPSFSSR